MEDETKVPEVTQEVAPPAPSPTPKPKSRSRSTAKRKPSLSKRNPALFAKITEKTRPMPLPITPAKINEKTRGNATWRPARITDIPTEMKDNRFVYRFILDNPNSIRKRLMEMWEIDTEIARKMDLTYGQRTLQTGLTVDGAYRVNELILARMPVEVAKSRREYFEKKSPVQGAQSAKERMAANIRNEGGDGRTGIYTQHPSGIMPDMNRDDRWDGTI